MARSGELDVRQRILEATRRLLVAEGLAGLSMRRIAREVGFSATTLYLYFESKDDLCQALVDDGLGRLHAAMEAAGRPAADPVARLRAICRAYLAFGYEQPEFYRIMFEPLGAARRDALNGVRPSVRQNLELLAGVLQHGAEKGVFAVERPDVSAFTVWSALHGTVSLMLGGRFAAGSEADRLSEHVVQQTIRSLIITEPADRWSA